MAKGIIRTQDITRMERILNSYVQEVGKTVVEENFVLAQEIMQESLSEVPRYTGALADSNFVTVKNNATVAFGYGGDNARINPVSGKSTTTYMVAVHENLEKVHPVGKAKFLQDPFFRKLVEITARIKKAAGSVRP